MIKVLAVVVTIVLLVGCSSAQKHDNSPYEYTSFEINILDSELKEDIEYQMFADKICGDDKYDAYLAEEDVIINGKGHTKYLCIKPKTTPKNQ